MKVDNDFKSVLAMIRRAMDLVNGDMPKKKIKSDKKSYIAFYEVQHDLIDPEAYYLRFLEQNKTEETEGDDYII